MMSQIVIGRDGRLSTSKVWRHIAFAVATYVIVVNANGMDWELLLAYMAVVSGSEVAKAIVQQRTGTTITEHTSTKVSNVEPKVKTSIGDGE